MTHHTLSYRLAVVFLMWSMSVAHTGCSRWMEVKAGEPESPAAAPNAAISSGVRVPIVLSSITVSQNGTAMAPPRDLERRVLDTLAESQLFSQFVYPSYRESAPSGQHVRAKLSVALFPNPHAGAAAWKGIVIGASMFLLTPVLPLEYEYGARMTLDIEREDATAHRYQAHVEGVARYHLFGATHLAVDELKAQVVDTCLTQLQRELVRDRQFVQAGLLAKHTPKSPAAPETVVVPTTAPVHRPAKTISVLRVAPR